LVAGHVKPLRLDYYRQIKSPLARKLFRILDKKAYVNKKVELPLFQLGINMLGLPFGFSAKKISSRIASASLELKNLGYIEQYAFTESLTDQRYKALWNL
jgi:hypothetical protein